MVSPCQKPWIDCTTFEELIGRTACSADSQRNVLTDGQLICSYQEIPNAIERIDRHFAAEEIGVQDCLAFECANSIPGALTLLYLLEKGYSFALLPPSHSTGVQSGRLSIPGFCRYKVTIESPLARKHTTHCCQPESFMRITKNEHYNEPRNLKSSAEAKMYMRTSGSLGSPKMAVHSRAKLLGNVLNCVKRFNLGCDDRIAIPVPIFHMYGLGAAFLPGIVVGASMDLQEKANILRYMGRERRFNPNIAFLTPALCEMLLKGHKSSRAYKLVVTAGDRIKKDTFLAFESRFGCLLNLYGSTEMGAIAAAGPDDPLEVRAVTVGKPMTGVQLRLEEKDVAPVGANNVGELYCKHKYGFAGYVDENGNRLDRDLTAQPDWFKTGDLGKIRQDGCIEVWGRCDHSVNRSGRLVLFADIERAMETITGIERVVVVTRGESKWGKRVVAFCVPGQRGATLGNAQARAACFDILPRYAIPDDVFVVNSLPTLPNGKVDRPTLAEMASEGHEEDTIGSAGRA
jgi:acyl-CoA synthetase (AMP-forming)/AMP-acid ligase II